MSMDICLEDGKRGHDSRAGYLHGARVLHQLTITLVPHVTSSFIMHERLLTFQPTSQTQLHLYNHIRIDRPTSLHHITLLQLHTRRSIQRISSYD